MPYYVITLPDSIFNNDINNTNNAEVTDIMNQLTLIEKRSYSTYVVNMDQDKLQQIRQKNIVCVPFQPDVLISRKYEPNDIVKFRAILRKEYHNRNAADLVAKWLVSKLVTDITVQSPERVQFKSHYSLIADLKQHPYIYQIEECLQYRIR